MLVSRGSRVRPLPPSPSPAGRGRGKGRGWGSLSPGLSPWATILRPYRGWCDLHHQSRRRETRLELRETQTLGPVSAPAGLASVYHKTALVERHAARDRERRLHDPAAHHRA